MSQGISGTNNNVNVLLVTLAPLVPIGLKQFYDSSLTVIADINRASIPYLESLAKKVYPVYEVIGDGVPYLEGALGVFFVADGFVGYVKNEAGFFRSGAKVAAGAALVIHAVCLMFPQTSDSCPAPSA